MTQHPSPIPCIIALGSNLGDSPTILQGALTRLSQHPQITLQQQSRWYRTAPVGPPQPDYLNGCVLLAVQLSPHALLNTLLEIEQEFGRVRRDPWGPRSLDLDIIFYGDTILETPSLTLPHPRMQDRAFVLIPLCDIAPQWVDPVTGKTVKDLANRLDCSGVHLQ
ncbi:2-amino-4-hydroxy-6-hydroxymethyldihydropteridine diphosphokinase [Spirulina sp. CS-785/01]|uniref:2-amino-4-hydroxy-6- hydroxymethyldihydropteridine diphosphokinase n=1 Tax=Spirulina sp. CS-785/01 TaxID=3021716 RepID=UPI00232F5B20|nr:2-amino-4-hydroxy-6-hydroxymethyldihydropteridine diphosphokinase [Spirulina sp. CS-785/01]MDB9312887.1 2-amino-4-hydroxy-6-hydroxymethyldihydropteridine diphosphokinase [Spirulina sp. CS-785/01]